jgi:hypothetical protein
MKIYQTIQNSIYIGNTQICIETDANGKFDQLVIASILISNTNEFTADSPEYVKHIRKNKKELKKELVEFDLWQKGIIKTIEHLYKKSALASICVGKPVLKLLEDEQK